MMNARDTYGGAVDGTARDRGMLAARSRWASCIGVTVLVAVGAAAEPCSAGTYVVRSCNVPGYPIAPTGLWRAVRATNVAIVDRCAAGGGLAFSLPELRGMHDLERASLEFKLPVDSSAIAFDRIRVWVSTRLSASPGFLMAGITDGDGIRSFARLENDLSGSTAVEALIPGGVRAAQVALTCRTESDRTAGEETTAPISASRTITFP